MSLKQIGIPKTSEISGKELRWSDQSSENRMLISSES